jgi:hypothetical protein
LKLIKILYSFLILRGLKQIKMKKKIFMIYNSDKDCMEWYNGILWYNACDGQESSSGTAVVSVYSSKSSSGVLTVGPPVSGVT